jgi:chromate transporter
MSLHDPLPSPWQLFRIWAAIGFQSFGGGASAQFLIQRVFIDRHGWLTAEEYLHLWGLCILTPGINMIALTVLIGRKMAGAAGIVASVAGLLLPSGAITCILAALFQHLAGVAAVQEILRGIVPATGGVMLVVGTNFARPLLRRGYDEGTFALLASCVLIVVCALAVIFLRLSIIVVILGAIGLGALFFTRRPAPPIVEEKKQVAQP